MKYKAFLSVILALLSITTLLAQEDSYRDLKKGGIPWERLYAGGNVGGALSEFSAFAEVSPLLGYRINDAFSAGAGFTFQYFNYKYYDSKNFFYGPRIFARYQLFRFLFAYSEYEHLILKYYSAQQPNGEKATSPNLYIGGGLSSGFENGTGSFVMLLYNLNDNLNNPFPNPSFRFGFTIGLGGR
jgi:long-subunit fatty acid transport protein